MNRKTREDYNQYILDTVETLKEQGEFSWQKVAELVFEKYPQNVTSVEAVRSAYRYFTNKSGYRDKKILEIAEDTFKREGIDELKERLVIALKRKNEITHLATRLGLELPELLTELTKLELDGFLLDKWKENGKSFVRLDRHRQYERGMNVLDLNVDKQIKFLVISDTHVGHKESQIKFMQTVIEDAYNKGVRKVLHAGDVTEGHYQSIRPTSIRELDAVGFDEQLELAYNVFPKLDGLQYLTISGK